MNGQAGEWDNASKDNPWYVKEAPKLGEEAVQVFVDYAGIPAQDVEQHILKIRDQAWNVAPFVCVGSWGFLNFQIRLNPVYDEVVKRTQSGELLLDAGVGVGQDLRLMVADGAPSTSLYATDLSEPFWNVGYDLFKDHQKYQGKFVEAKLPDDIDKLAHLKGKLSFIHAANFFHLFELEQQEAIASALLSLLKGKNSIIFGRQVGTRLDTRMQRTPFGSCYRWAPDNLEEFWTRMADKAGIKLEVQSYLKDHKKDHALTKPRPGTEQDPLVMVVFAARVL